MYRYERLSAIIAGVLISRRYIEGLASPKPSAITAAHRTEKEMSAVFTVSLTFKLFLAPKYFATITEQPPLQPSANANRILTMVEESPTAVSAV